MTNALLLILLGAAQSIASDVAVMRGRPLIGLACSMSSLFAGFAGFGLLLAEAFA